MAEKHTPAPWWTTDSGVRDRGGYICHTNPAPRYEGQDERFAKETAERAANKLLIAASPELLASAQAVLAWWNEWAARAPQDDAIEAAEWGEFHALRAAINKATGAQQ